jgi:hypothetical protein
MSCSKEDLKLVDPFFMKSRKAGITLHVLSQDWTRLPLFWRRNFTYAVFKNISARQLRRIAGDVTSDITPSQFVELYQQAIQRKQDWFFVDKSSSSQSNLSVEILANCSQGLVRSARRNLH